MKQYKNMKKSISLLVSLTLMCALLLACAGCGDKEADALVGDWQATIDMTDMVNDEMKAGLGNDAELMSYFNISDFTIKINLSFGSDGTYKLTADQASLEQSLDAVVATFRDGIINYFEDMIAQQGVDMTVDEVLEASGYTLDDFLEEAFDKQSMMSSMSEMNSSGTFKAKSGILSLNDGKETGLEAYELDGNKLTLTGEGVEDSDLVGLYPLVFTKK